MNTIIRDRALIHDNDFTYTDYAAAQAVTATSGGATTGIINSGIKVVFATSANSAYFVTLPQTPTVGQKIRIMVISATGAKLQPYTSGHYINGVACGGIGATGVALTIAAGATIDVICVASNKWVALTAPSSAGLPA